MIECHYCHQTCEEGQDLDDDKESHQRCIKELEKRRDEEYCYCCGKNPYISEGSCEDCDNSGRICSGYPGP